VNILSHAEQPAVSWLQSYLARYRSSSKHRDAQALFSVQLYFVFNQNEEIPVPVLPLFMFLSTCLAFHFGLLQLDQPPIAQLDPAKQSCSCRHWRHNHGAGSSTAWCSCPGMFTSTENGAFPLLARSTLAEVYFSCSLLSSFFLHLHFPVSSAP